MPGAAGMVEEARFFEKAAQIGGIMPTERFAVAERQLEGGAFQMSQEDFEVIRVDESMLGRPSEEVVRMLHDVLIERRAGGHHDGGGGGLPPPGAAGALPTRGNGPGITGHDD